MIRRRGDIERTYRTVAGVVLCAAAVAMFWFGRGSEKSGYAVLGAGLLLLDPKHVVDMGRMYFARGRGAPPADGAMT